MDKKALMIERDDQGFYKLLEVTIPEDGRKKISYRELGQASTIEVAAGRMKQSVYDLYYPK